MHTKWKESQLSQTTPGVLSRCRWTEFSIKLKTLWRGGKPRINPHACNDYKKKTLMSISPEQSCIKKVICPFELILDLKFHLETTKCDDGNVLI